MGTKEMSNSEIQMRMNHTHTSRSVSFRPPQPVSLPSLSYALRKIRSGRKTRQVAVQFLTLHPSTMPHYAPMAILKLTSNSFTQRRNFQMAFSIHVVLAEFGFDSEALEAAYLKAGLGISNGLPW